MADATIRLDQPEIVDTDARLDAESRVVAALTVLLERVRITGAGERYMDVNAASEGLVHDADALAKLDSILIELNTKLDAGGTVALDAATLAALETITAVVSGTVALDAATLAALESTTVAVSNFPAVQPVSDNGGSLTVDGPLTDVELRAVPVPVSGTVSVAEPVSVDDNGGSLTVDGSVAVSNFPATQPVTGPLTDVELRAVPVPVSGTVAVTEPVSVDDNGGSLTIDGSVAVSNFPATQPVSGTVEVTNDVGNPLPVSGTVSVTEPVSVDDNGGSLTVDGPLTDAELRTTPVPVSGTITANLGTIDGAATETTLLALEGKVPDEEGTWGYYGGASGTVIVGAGERVIGIAAVATAGGATLVINGGDSIPIPTDIGVDLAPRANLVAPTIVFSGTASFVVEVLN